MLRYYFRLGLLSIRANPALSALMIAAIAIGIGACMTIVTVRHVMADNPIEQPVNTKPAQRIILCPGILVLGCGSLLFSAGKGRVLHEALDQEEVLAVQRIEHDAALLPADIPVRVDSARIILEKLPATSPFDLCASERSHHRDR